MNENDLAYERYKNLPVGSLVWYGELGDQVKGQTASEVRRCIDGPALVYIVGEIYATYAEFIRPVNERKDRMDAWRELPSNWGGDLGVVRVGKTCWRITEWAVLAADDETVTEKWTRHWKTKDKLVVAATISNRRTRQGSRFYWTTFTTKGVKLSEGWSEKCRLSAKLALDNLRKVLTLPNQIE